MLIKYAKIGLANYISQYSGLQKQSWLIIFSQFIESIFIGMCYFLPMYFFKQLHFDISLTGYIISFFGIGTVVGGAIGGYLADKLHPRWIVIISLFFESICFFLLSFLHTPVALMMNVFLLGVSTYSFITTNFLWALSYCHDNEEQKIKTITILGTVANLGLGISALILSAPFMHDLHIFSLTAGISSFVMAGYLLCNHQFNVKSTPTHNHTLTASMTSDHSEYHSNIIIAFVITCLFLIGLIISQLSSTYAIHLNTLFPSYYFNSFGLLFAVNTFIVVILQTPIANYSRRYHHKLLIGGGAFLLGFGMFMLTFSYTFSLVLLACVIYTLGEILFFSVAQLMCYEHAPANKRGFILGIYRMVYASSRIIGPAAGGYMYQQFGGDSLWYVCGVIGSVCLMTSIYFEYSHTRVQMAHR